MKSHSRSPEIIESSVRVIRKIPPIRAVGWIGCAVDAVVSTGQIFGGFLKAVEGFLPMVLCLFWVCTNKWTFGLIQVVNGLDFFPVTKP